MGRGLFKHGRPSAGFQGVIITRQNKRFRVGLHANISPKVVKNLGKVPLTVEFDQLVAKGMEATNIKMPGEKVTKWHKYPRGFPRSRS